MTSSRGGARTAGHGDGGRGHQEEAQARASLGKATGPSGMACCNSSGEVSGGWSSNVDGLDTTVRGMASGLQLRALQVLTNPLDTVV